MNGLDLFSGIGGISLALSEWVRTVAYCESDRYAQGVLLSRMQSGDIDRAPIWDDVRTLKKEMLPEIDIITGGFPCQDISLAGRGAGLEGERSGLFFEIVRLTRDLRPKFLFLENVPAIRTRGLDVIIKKFSLLGYDCRWTIVSAGEVEAPHIRKRWFLLAYSGSKGRQQNSASSFGYESTNERRTEKKDYKFKCVAQTNLWLSGHGGFHRMDDGLYRRLDRLRCLGNSVVPKQAREAFMRLSGLKGAGL